MTSSAKSGSGGYSNYWKTAQVGTDHAGYQKARTLVSRALEEQGKSQAWLEPLLELVGRESTYNPNAKNPKSSAAGLFQFLDGTRKNYGGTKVDWSDPYQQTLAGIQYVADRYGTPEKALTFWDKNKWY